MDIDSAFAKATRALIAKNTTNSSQFDWFVIGFLYNTSSNTKSVEEIFNNVSNITHLARNGALQEDETDEILLRMMKKALHAEMNKSVPKESFGNFLTNGSKASTQPTETSNQNSASKSKQNGDSPQKKSRPVRKSSTIEFDDLMEDALSYESDRDKKKNGGRGNKNTNQDDFDLEELDPGKGDFARKPVNQVDVSDLWDDKNLKRGPVVDDEETMELIKRLQAEDEMMMKQQKKTREMLDQDEALIRKLQEEDNQLIEARKKKEEQESADVNCSICLDSLMGEAFLPLTNCEHIFHEKCLEEYLKAEVTARNLPIRCPVNCGKEMLEVDIKQVLDKEYFTKFSEYSLQKYISTHADEISCCPTANCNYAFVQDEKGDGNEDTELKCPMCKKKYCLNCRVEFHKNQTCKEYQISNKRDANDIKFEKFIKGKKFKQCAKCKFWVEKNQGCDHMTCRCKYEFCYKCGGKYRECECVKKLQLIAQQRQQRQQANKANKRRRR